VSNTNECRTYFVCIGYGFIFLKTNLILMIGFVGVLFYIMFVLRYKGVFETDSLTSMGVDDSWMNSKDAAVWGNVV
jgi:hypothetical protein